MTPTPSETALSAPQELVDVFHRAYCLASTMHAMPPCGERADRLWATLARSQPATEGLDADRLAKALHEANVECDYSRKFDRKSCAPGDGAHSITARAIIAALAASEPDA